MDQHEAHAEAIRSNNLLLKGTYEDGYKAGFKAGHEAGRREAVHALLAKWDRGDIVCIAHCEAAILSAIGGDK